MWRPTSAQDRVPLELLRIIHGFPAGGNADATARRVAERLRGSYASAVVVETRTGAGGRIAIEAVKNAAPDGATLLVTPMSTMSIYPHVYKKLSYSPFTDLTPVSIAATFANALAVGPAVPDLVKSIGELLEWMAKAPSRAVYGSPSAGTAPHFLGAQIAQLAGVRLVHVPYRGSVPGVADLIGGQIPLMITALGDFLAQASAGKIRVLAISEEKRSRFAPQVPTLAESGFPAINFSEWLGVFAPARTAPHLISIAAAIVRQAVATKEMRDALATFGLEAKRLDTRGAGTSDARRFRALGANHPNNRIHRGVLNNDGR